MIICGYLRGARYYGSLDARLERKSECEMERERDREIMKYDSYFTKTKRDEKDVKTDYNMFIAQVQTGDLSIQRERGRE